MKPVSIDLSAPQVMAILNVTPDSFYAGSGMPMPGLSNSMSGRPWPRVRI